MSGTTLGTVAGLLSSRPIMDNTLCCLYKVGHTKLTPQIMLFVLHLYMFGCKAIQYFNRRFFLHKMKQKLDKYVKILNRNITI